MSRLNPLCVGLEKLDEDTIALLLPYIITGRQLREIKSQTSSVIFTEVFTLLELLKRFYVCGMRDNDLNFQLLKLVLDQEINFTSDEIST